MEMTVFENRIAGRCQAEQLWNRVPKELRDNIVYPKTQERTGGRHVNLGRDYLWNNANRKTLTVQELKNIETELRKPKKWCSSAGLFALMYRIVSAAERRFPLQACLGRLHLLRKARGRKVK